jgi:hypothetical protein
MFTTNAGNYNIGMDPFWVHLLLFLMCFFPDKK